MVDSPRPGARAPPPGSCVVTGGAATAAALPDRGSDGSDRCGASPGRSRVPVKNSVGSLTRGPSQNSGAGFASRSTRCYSPVN